MSIRICVCIDIEEKTPLEAYRKLYDAIDKMTDETKSSWESTDEWYGRDGEPIPEDIVVATRLQVLAEKDTERSP